MTNKKSCKEINGKRPIYGFEGVKIQQELVAYDRKIIFSKPSVSGHLEAQCFLKYNAVDTRRCKLSFHPHILVDWRMNVILSEDRGDIAGLTALYPMWTRIATQVCSDQGGSVQWTW
jgi:hypothetical protein